VKALIFGANGQDGHYLSDSCLKQNIEVIGASQNGPWMHGDVASPIFVKDLIRNHRPSYIFHLAASSTTSHDVLYENHESIGKGTINILESCRKFSPETKVFITGSGLQFINKGLPISETDPFDHNSAYSVSRNYSVYLARYFRKLGLKTYIGYLFHHESPLRGPNHISQRIIQAVSRIALGSKEYIELGDISVMKEWSYAGDIAEGIITLVRQDNIFEAVIGSGQAYTIERWLDESFRLINRNWKNYVREKKDYISEYKILVSNPATINSLGWKTTTPISTLAEIMLGHITNSKQ
jgi:GDPmannose 4,6-dehydratase